MMLSKSTWQGARDRLVTALFKTIEVSKNREARTEREARLDNEGLSYLKMTHYHYGILSL